MRMSEVLGVTKKANTARRITRLGFVITGILSIVIIAVTIYGQYTGMFVIAITRDISEKGIILSETFDFRNPEDLLTIKPIKEVQDLTEQMLEVEEAENTDGQYFGKDKNNNYIAYTFYIKNTGKETINIEYQVNILKEYKNVGKAATLKVINTLYDSEKEEFHQSNRTETIYRITEDPNILAYDQFLLFKPGEIRKLTIFLYFDGRYTDPSMAGGSLKLEWFFAIADERLTE